MIEKNRIEDRLQKDGIDGIIATSAENVFYMSGFKGPLDPQRFCMWSMDNSGPYMILPNGDTDLLITNELKFQEVYSYGNYYYYRGENLSDREEKIMEINFKNNSSNGIEALVEAITDVIGKNKKIALETKNLTMTDLEKISKKSKCDILPAEKIFSSLRKIKTREEIKRLRKSVEITENAIEYSVGLSEIGMTERDLEKIYKKKLIDLGGEPGFCLIGFGPHSAESCIPGEIKLKEKDIILYDAGCSYEGYASDIARTFLFGDGDSDAEEKYKILKNGMDKAISLVHDGADTADVFGKTMEYIRSEGSKKGINNLAEFRRHHLGHGIGISTYDDPLITPIKNRIAANMVMCIEPPYYEIGNMGIQVEDEILVTYDGIERLSNAPDEMTCI